ncbi:MAG: hypothetical protein JWQ88_2696 [Rhodoferax sp.]|nr:hypothetical protein [Rhodoferax sp.]
MLELATGAVIDQSEGLRHWMPASAAPGVRLMAMVSRGEPRTEQPLLWQVCTTLQSLGHRVAVLDGTTAESGGNPGLQDLLDHAHWLEQPDRAEADWQIVPARSGLAQMARLADESLAQETEDDMPLRALGPLFKNFQTVLLYTRADILGSLLCGTGVRPLLAMAPSKSSIVNGYQTLKQLLQKTCRMPIVASLVTAPQKAAEQRATVAASSLRHCAATYLGLEADVMNVRSFPQHDKPSEDTPRLVQHLLESAAALGDAWRAPSIHREFSAVHLARSQ